MVSRFNKLNARSLPNSERALEDAEKVANEMASTAKKNHMVAGANGSTFLWVILNPNPWVGVSFED